MAKPPPRPPPLKIDLRAILSESSRILNDHTLHFSTLSLLFLLPFSFSFPVYPLINQLFPPIFNLLYALIISIFFLFSTGSITHSVHQVYHGLPVNLSSSIKAVFTTFYPLVPTDLVRELILYWVSLILVLVFTRTVKHLSSSKVNCIIICLVYVFIFVFVVAYLQVNRIHANVVLVYESIRGPRSEPAPLNPSDHNLAIGIKVAFKMMLFFAFFLGLIDTWSSVIRSVDLGGDKWKSWVFVVNIVVVSMFHVLFMLYNLAANTVFEARHREHAKGLASLPCDDESSSCCFHRLSFDGNMRLFSSVQVMFRCWLFCLLFSSFTLCILPPFRFIRYNSFDTVINEDV